MWVPYRNGVLKKISDKYGVVDHKGNLKTAGTATTPEQVEAQQQQQPAVVVGSDAR